jgi:hypothetical protein
MKRIYPTLFFLLLALVVIQFFTPLWSFGNEEKITSQGVVDRIKDTSELNTVEMYFSEIIDYEKALTFKKIEIPFTQKSFIFTVKARVKAGVDLSILQKSDVVINEDERSLTIQLPDPTITSKEILSYQAYSEKNGLFNEVKNEDTLKALETFQVDLEKQAIDYGILNIAKQNAEKALSNIFKTTGFEDVKIKWE